MHYSSFSLCQAFSLCFDLLRQGFCFVMECSSVNVTYSVAVGLKTDRETLTQFTSALQFTASAADHSGRKKKKKLLVLKYKKE